MISLIPTTASEVGTFLHFTDEEAEFHMVVRLAKVTLGSALGSESHGCALDFGF